jgi:RNA polymerase sigma-70 factor (ECF subfamily)
MVQQTDEESSPGASTSVSLLDRVRRNDEEGWKRLAELYGPLIEHWCRCWGLTDADSADVRQEVFQSVHRSLEKFERSQRGAFRSWLKTVTRNKVHDLHRARASQPTIDQSAVEQGVASREWEDDIPEATEISVLYRRAMDLIQMDFNESTWKAFVATVVDDRPPHDVAAELGISPNAVYIARSRVLARLRAEFSELIE